MRAVVLVILLIGSCWSESVEKGDCSRCGSDRDCERWERCIDRECVRYEGFIRCCFQNSEVLFPFKFRECPESSHSPGACGCVPCVNSSGSVIPFDSGQPLRVAAYGPGPDDTDIGAVGFGNSNSFRSLSPINAEFGTTSFAFIAPRDGVITSIAGYFLTEAVSIQDDSFLRLQIQLYDWDFRRPIPGSLVSFSPVFTPFTPQRTNVTLVAPVQIPIRAGTGIMLSFEGRSPVRLPIGDQENILEGYASAGINFV